MKDFIRLTEAVQIDRRIQYRFESSLPLFVKKDFYVEYTRDFQAPSAGILAMPFASVMISISWMTGADLEMDVLDEAFAESLGKAKLYFQKWFSNKWSFAGALKARTEKNEGGGRREAMLYSGGMDALTTYIGHRSQKPVLFSFFGADIPLDQTKLVKDCRKSFEDFAQNEGIDLWCIESNLWSLFDHKKLKQWAENWWGQAAHATVLGALTAPVCYRDVGRLWIASSHVRDSVDYGWGSDYHLDNLLCWAGTRMEQDLPDKTRFQKVKLFAQHPDLHRYLRVCFTWWKWSGDQINCCSCEKCYRTVCELLLNGADPAGCNFKVTEDMFRDMKTSLQKRHAYYTYFHGVPAALEFWRDIRRAAAGYEGFDRPASKEFFKWLKDFKRLDTLRTDQLGRLIYWLRETRWKLVQKFKK